MSGAGNCFVVLDGRTQDAEEFRNPARIGALCREYSTDGLMILGEAQGKDFSMEFYNPDGSGGMMCGNGGRCICAFADFLGVEAAVPGRYSFLAPDGPHVAEILGKDGPDGRHVWTVRLQMKDVDGIAPVLGGFFLDTGTRHFVKFVEDIEAMDVEKEGKELRWRREFAPEGSNVNFVRTAPEGLYVRTFEKGVEGETLACGTGITASALAAFHAGKLPGAGGKGERVAVKVKARRDWLEVDFEAGPAGSFRQIHLTGPAEFI